MTHEQFVKDTNNELLEKGYSIKQIQDYWGCLLNELEECNE